MKLLLRHFGRLTWAAFFSSLAIAILFRSSNRFGFHIPLVVPAVYVAFIFAYLLLHTFIFLGTRRGLGFFIIAFSISYTMECLGVKTGLPFGPYSYGDSLGIKLLTVPLAIPGLWFGMSYGAYWLARLLLGYEPAQPQNSILKSSAFVLLGTHALVTWDLAADPVAVGHGYWQWHTHGHYFGIPVQNYGGWWLTGILIFTAVSIWFARTTSEPSDRNKNWLALAPAGGYVCGVVNHCYACVQLGQPGAALAAFMSLTPLVILSGIKLVQHGNKRTWY